MYNMLYIYYGVSTLILFFLDNENLIFRGNTFATKAVDTYMKMVGETVSLTLPLMAYSGTS